MRRCYILNMSYQRPNKFCCILNEIKKKYLFDPWNILHYSWCHFKSTSHLLSSTAIFLFLYPVIISFWYLKVVSCFLLAKWKCFDALHIYKKPGNDLGDIFDADVDTRKVGCIHTATAITLETIAVSITAIVLTKTEKNNSDIKLKKSWIYTFFENFCEVIKVRCVLTLGVFYLSTKSQEFV